MHHGLVLGSALALVGLAAIPAAAQRGDGMGAFPQVTQGPSDTLVATFHQNGCTITYDRRTGRQLTSRSGCTSAQRNFADTAIADYRRASPAEELVGRDAYGRDVTDDPYRDRRGRYRYDRGERPQVVQGVDGNLSASFRSPVCVVYFRPDGRRINQTQLCSSAQVSRARRAIADWRHGGPR